MTRNTSFENVLKETPIILFFNRPPWIDKKTSNISACPYRCILTDNVTRWTDAEAVIFVASLSSLNPKKKKEKGQIWILFVIESPFTIKPRYQNFNNTINWTMSYRLDSDVFLRQLYIEKTKRSDYGISNKTTPINWMVSNCKTSSRRDKFTELLQKYVQVDIYGRCGSLKTKCKGPIDHKCFQKLFAKYFFYLSFENSFCRDYITEKAFNPLIDGAVPIVRGAAKYEKYMPTQSYINTDSFKSIKELAVYLQYLIKNEDEKYRKYFDWKKHYDVKFIANFAMDFCELCRRLYFKENYQRLYQSVHDWWDEAGNCSKSINDLRS